MILVEASSCAFILTAEGRAHGSHLVPDATAEGRYARSCYNPRVRRDEDRGAILTSRSEAK